MQKAARIAFLVGLGLCMMGCHPSGGAPAVTPLPRATAVPTPTPLPSPVPVTVKLTLVAEGMAAPLALAAPTDGSGRLLVADQMGVIWVLVPAEDGYQRLDAPFLDLQPRLVPLQDGYEERGLLGLALHPDFAQNGRLFVYYSAPAPAGSQADHISHVAEFVAGPLENQVALESERVILKVEQPTPAHNGGALAFGPDGYLYISLGDGGPGHDPEHRAQDLTQLHGKILRIDVDSDAGEPYAVPEDNPMMADLARSEIFAYGFRNPYRFSFDDGGTRSLILGDVGHDSWEEVNVVVAGGNYGWSIREGKSCFTPPTEKTPRTSCPEAGADGLALYPPVMAYDHQQGVAIVGGYVYRGTAVAGLAGHYLFGDWGWSQGTLFVTGHPIHYYDITPAGSWQMQPLQLDPSGDTLEGRHLLGFGQDVDHELYVLTSGKLSPAGTSGQVFKIMPTHEVSCYNCPVDFP